MFFLSTSVCVYVCVEVCLYIRTKKMYKNVYICAWTFACGDFGNILLCLMGCDECPVAGCSCAAFSPLIQRPEAVDLANRVKNWLKAEEQNLFILSSPVWAK
mgnify:CR=1 FL=1